MYNKFGNLDEKIYYRREWVELEDTVTGEIVWQGWVTEGTKMSIVNPDGSIAQVIQEAGPTTLYDANGKEIEWDGGLDEEPSDSDPLDIERLEFKEEGNE